METPHPRIAFWGTPALTTVYLEALTAAGMTPAVIITNPDRPKGRGHELAPTPAKVWGLEHNVRVLQPEVLDDTFYAELAGMAIGISVVVAYGSILPQRFIDLPKHGTLNVHYSLLPKYRGASPVEASILEGDTETGASIQVMARQLDSGPIIAEAKTEIGATETAPDLRMRLSALGAELLVHSLPRYTSGLLSATPQDDTAATFCGKIQKENGFIDLADPATLNYRKYRAYYDWPRTYFFFEPANQPKKKIRVIITAAHMEEGQFVIDRVLPEGKKEMTYGDFLRGYGA